MATIGLQIDEIDNSQVQLGGWGIFFVAWRVQLSLWPFGGFVGLNSDWAIVRQTLAIEGEGANNVR